MKMNKTLLATLFSASVLASAGAQAAGWCESGKPVKFAGQNHKFNTAIAQVMTLMNVLKKAPQATEQDRALVQEGLETVVLLLAPITPHISHDLWSRLGHSGAVIDAGWPVQDDSALVQDTLQLVIQVNGKLRGHIDMPASASREDVEAAARVNENVLRFTEGLTIRKVIVVPGKLVNIVAGGASGLRFSDPGPLCRRP